MFKSKLMALILFAVLMFSGGQLSQKIGTFDNGNTDFGRTYALSHEYIKYGARLSTKPYLGEMNYYPSASHQAVALFAKTFYKSDLFEAFANSKILLVFIFCTVPGFLLASFLKNSRDRILNFALFSLIGVVSYKLLGFMTTSELRGNFYFAQASGEAASLILLLLFVRLFKANHSYTAALLAISAWPLAYIHLLPALRQAAAAMILACLPMTIAFFKFGKRKMSRIQAAAFLVTLFTSVALVLFHPTFSAMKKIAESDGHTALFVPFWVSMLLMSGLSIAATRQRLWGNDQTTLAEKDALLAFCLGSVGLLVLQYLALIILSLGSMYAVRKNMFATITFLVLYLCTEFRAEKFTTLKPVFSKLPEKLSRIQIGFVIFVIGLFFTDFQIGKPRVDLDRARYVAAKLDAWHDKTLGKTAVQDLKSSDHMNCLFNMSHLELRREVTDRFLDPEPMNLSALINDVPSIEKALVLPRSAEEKFKLNATEAVFKKLIFSD